MPSSAQIRKRLDHPIIDVDGLDPARRDGNEVEALLRAEDPRFVESDMMAALRAYACDNAIRLHAHTNPDFFAGTIAEDSATGFRRSDRGR